MTEELKEIVVETVGRCVITESTKMLVESELGEELPEVLTPIMVEKLKKSNRFNVVYKENGEVHVKQVLNG